MIELEGMEVKGLTLIYSVFTQKLFQFWDFRSRDCGDDLACMEDILCQLACKQTCPTHFRHVRLIHNSLQDKSNIQPAGTKTVFPASSPLYFLSA